LQKFFSWIALDARSGKKIFGAVQAYGDKNFLHRDKADGVSQKRI